VRTSPRPNHDTSGRFLQQFFGYIVSHGRRVQPADIHDCIDYAIQRCAEPIRRSRNGAVGQSLPQREGGRQTTGDLDGAHQAYIEVEELRLA